MTENVILEKSYTFSIRIIKLYQFLKNEKNEHILSRQLLRSGTSIGANAEEAIGAQSKKDFLAKMHIAHKESRETHYWIRLMRDTKILTKEQATSILTDCEELKKILYAITHSKKQ